MGLTTEVKAIGPNLTASCVAMIYLYYEEAAQGMSYRMLRLEMLLHVRAAAGF
jgi:hypothetical protein